MLEVSTTGWLVTIGVVVLLLVADLALSAYRPRAVGFREAAAQSVFYIGVAIAFGVVFGSIGVKLVLHFGHLQEDAIPEIATSTSLGVIVVVLTVTTIASLLRVRRDPAARAHAGTLRSQSREDRPTPV